MTQKKLFYRKIVYIIIIAALLFPLYRMGNPAQRKAGGALSQGGTLAQIRNRAGLAETNLGQIDPASSTMKLATFGMRGVAIALLWNRSLEYEKKADWANVVATGNQIIMLEPHFISIWDFVGWKLAYNASAQYDDYRERYRWVIRGFEFLQKGTIYNQNAPKLFQKAGWTISQKIGVADEKSQYRRLFREDDEFHDKQVYKERDNWLFGRNFYHVAEDLFEKGGDIGKETRLIFYSRSPMNLVHYAEWMEQDGCGVTKDNTPIFDEEHAAAAWKTAAEHWEELCKKRVKTVIPDRTKEGAFREVSLNEYLECQAETEELTKQIEAMLPEGKTVETIMIDRWTNVLTDQMRGALYPSLLSPYSEYDQANGKMDKSTRAMRKLLDEGKVPDWENWREKLHEVYLSLFSDDLRPLVDRPEIYRSEEDNEKLSEINSFLNQWQSQAKFVLLVTPRVLADQVEGDAQHEALDLCDRMSDLTYQSNFSSMYRDIMDCDRHAFLMKIEPLEEARMARQKRHEARVRYNSGQLEEASRSFLDSMASWRKIIDMPEFERISYMSQFESMFITEIEKYTIILDQLERIFPEDYPLETVAQRQFDTGGAGKMFTDAEAFLDQELSEGKCDTGIAHALALMINWNTYFTSGNEIAPFLPTRQSRNGIVYATKKYIDAMEGMPEESQTAVIHSGFLNQYPLKNMLELYISKGEPLYQEIQNSEVEVMTDPDHAIDHLRKAVDLWAQMIVKYPILKYDTASVFYSEIQKTATQYIAALTQKGEEKPADFPLEKFLP